MKSTIISMFIVLIVMITIPMFLFGDGDLAQKFGFGTGDAAENLRDKAPKNIRAVVTDKEFEVYKWVDEHGVTQFGGKPPQVGTASEKIILSPNANVIDAVKMPEKEALETAKPQVYSVGSPYSPDGMKKLVDDSMNVQEMLNQRQADQDKMMQGMFKQK